jgi:hypothetical protein
VTLRAGGRAIPIVRVHVEPRPGITRPTGLFRGELDLDATRRQIVRLRGTFVRVPGPAGTRARLTRSLAEGYAFVEYVNAERAGEYWLPSYQRIELQATSVLIGDVRGIIRMVSRFGAYRLNDTTLAAADLARGDSVRADTTGRLRFANPRRLTYAAGDSISRFDRWDQQLGDASSAVNADDFADVGPERWRTTGAPRLEVRPERMADLFHYNRVEGAYTGAGARLRLRDLAPGVTLRAAAGYAWSERTVRGRVALERDRGRWVVALRAGRSLDITNDFRDPFDSGSTLAALFSADNYDYVDRRHGTATVTRRFAATDAALRAELGVASDRGAIARLERGPFRGDSAFRPNRGVDPGRYLRTALVLELHPNVNAEFLQPGTGARLTYERGAGELDWQRLEARGVARRNWRGFTGAVRADAGALLARQPPPQQLFEIGSHQNLPGYGYKEFAGDRAAVTRALVMYTSPFLRAPIRFGRGYSIPGLSPGVSAGVQAGWTELSDAAARAANLRLGAHPDPLDGPPIPYSRATGGVRSTVNAGLRFFGGGVFLGVARPIDHGGPWRTVFSLSPEL